MMFGDYSTKEIYQRTGVVLDAEGDPVVSPSQMLMDQIMDPDGEASEPLQWPGEDGIVEGDGANSEPPPYADDPNVQNALDMYGTNATDEIYDATGVVLDTDGNVIYVKGYEPEYPNVIAESGQILDPFLASVEISQLMDDPSGSITLPSGRYDENALPTGNFAKIRRRDDYYTTRSLYRENEAALILAINGYDIELKPKLTTTSKDPDYRIEGKIFDCYSPEPYTGVRSIQSTIDDKVNEKEQADRIVLSLNNWQGNIEDVKEELQDYPVDNLKEVLVVQDGRVFSIYP